MHYDTALKGMAIVMTGTIGLAGPRLGREPGTLAWWGWRYGVCWGACVR